MRLFKLANFQWYRRWRGGIWWHLHECSCDKWHFYLWTRQGPRKDDWCWRTTVYAIEDYTILRPRLPL